MSVSTMSMGVAGTDGSMMMLSPLISWKYFSTVRRSAPEKSRVIGLPVYFFSLAPERTTDPLGGGADPGGVAAGCWAAATARAACGARRGAGDGTVAGAAADAGDATGAAAGVPLSAEIGPAASSRGVIDAALAI